MFALSPVFGILADRLGRVPTSCWARCCSPPRSDGLVRPESTTFVTIALVLLGLGWSATTVAGATLLTEASSQRSGHVGRGSATSP